MSENENAFVEPPSELQQAEHVADEQASVVSDDGSPQVGLHESNVLAEPVLQDEQEKDSVSGPAELAEPIEETPSEAFDQQ